MIDNRVIELINKEVDGVASAEETAHLKLVLKDNPEARKLFEEIRLLSKAMANVERADSPLTLKPSIMRALDSRNILKKPVTRLSRLLKTLQGSVLMKPTFIFAGGLAAGVLIFLFTSDYFLSRTVDDSELTGTLVLQGHVPGFSPGDRIDINRNSMKGSIETQFSPGLCLLRLRLDAREMVSVSLLTDAASVQIEAVRPVDDSGARLSLHDGELTLGETKSGGVVVLFSSKAKPVPPARLRLTSSGQPIFDASIALEKTH